MSVEPLDRSNYVLRSSADDCAPDAVCSMCGGPVPGVHAHAFYQIPEDTFVYFEQHGPAYMVEASRGLQAALARAIQAGFCSEGCGLQWQAGEETNDERREREEWERAEPD